MSRAKQLAGIKALEQANAHLTSNDPAFSAIIAHAGQCPIGVSTDRDDPFASLVTCVVSQQLSTTAASTISARLITHAGGKLRPDVLLNSNPEQLRAVGLSGAKVRTIQGLAGAIEQGNLDLDGLAVVTFPLDEVAIGLGQLIKLDEDFLPIRTAQVHAEAVFRYHFCFDGRTAG